MRNPKPSLIALVNGVLWRKMAEPKDKQRSNKRGESNIGQIKTQRASPAIISGPPFRSIALRSTLPVRGEEQIRSPILVATHHEEDGADNPSIRSSAYSRTTAEIPLNSTN